MRGDDSHILGLAFKLSLLKIPIFLFTFSHGQRHYFNYFVLNVEFLSNLFFFTQIRRGARARCRLLRLFQGRPEAHPGAGHAEEAARGDGRGEAGEGEEGGQAEEGDGGEDPADKAEAAGEAGPTAVRAGGGGR